MLIFKVSKLMDMLLFFCCFSHKTEQFQARKINSILAFQILIKIFEYNQAFLDNAETLQFHNKINIKKTKYFKVN